MAGRLYQFPKNHSSLILLFQVWKNDSVCVCVTGVGANGLQVEVWLPKEKGLSHGKAGDAFDLPEQEQWPVVTVSPPCIQENSSSLDVWL